MKTNEERNKLNELAKNNPELAFELMTSLDGMKVFGTCGQTIENDKAVKFIECFKLIKSHKDMSKINLNSIKLRNRMNPQRHMKCFVLNLEDESTFNHLNERLENDNEGVAEFINGLNPEYF